MLPCVPPLPAAGLHGTAADRRRAYSRCHDRSRPPTSLPQFIRGIDEPVIPDVRLTRSRDGSSGTATFTFDNPSIFEAREWHPRRWMPAEGGCSGGGSRPCPLARLRLVRRRSERLPPLPCAPAQASSELGDITGLYMIDDEGVLQTVEVQARTGLGWAGQGRAGQGWTAEAPLATAPMHPAPPS